MSYDWFKSIGSPRYVVAPMVDASELAWRILCRHHGAQLCYSPMFHSNIFTKDAKYRKDSLATCKEDRPLIIQFCGNNPDIMAAAAKLAENYCDAIDINLGCPQAIAKRGKYGSFLQDDWQLLHNIVSTISKVISIPVTCKVRIFENIEKSVEYALMLQDAGCKLLTVHGRTREQKGPLTGVASWEHIKAIKKAVSIPMFANGNIQWLGDVNRCLNFTQVDGVMSAEGILTNPALFEGINPVSWEMAEEYLDLVEKYPCPSSYIRGHLFKLFHKIFAMEVNNDDRQLLATAQTHDDFKRVCTNLKNNYIGHHVGKIPFNNKEQIGCNLLLPPWFCQPYVRMSPEEHTHKMELIKNQVNDVQCKRMHEDQEGKVISRKKMKKMRRIMRRPLKTDLQTGRSGEICVDENCPNPLGGKCEYQLCKKCCKTKCYNEDLDCKGHRILVHSRRRIAKQLNELKTAD